MTSSEVWTEETAERYDAGETVQILVSHHFSREGDRYRRDDSRHRYAWPAELDLMARIAGLELEERVADWDGTPFTSESTKHVSVWRKPAQSG